MEKKVIIVEGLSDKMQLHKVIDEEIDIICTHGTFGIEKFDRMLYEYDLDHREVYIFVDADDSGMKLRKQLTAELPHAHQMYIPAEFVEVESTPEMFLTAELMKHDIKVNRLYFT